MMIMTKHNKFKASSRRTFLRNTMVLGSAGLGLASFQIPKQKNKTQQKAADALSDLKITRIRFYEAPTRSMVNQSAHIVTIETDQGITGVGEGGTAFLVSQLAGLLIGKNPLMIENLWQVMYRGNFYPPGREKIHALGALDLALWDIKGKVLNVPVHLLLGGRARNFVECYVTAYPGNLTLQEKARASMEEGFRAFRMSVADPRSEGTFNPHYAISDTVKNCEEVWKGVGPDGDWCIDFHTRLDLNDAVYLANRIEELNPYFVEDLIRSENQGVYQKIREMVKVPIAVGEQFGDRWDITDMIENDWIDYSRISLPNAGGITEFMKISALCETHYVGLIPHFTGPVATAALVHACMPWSGPVMMEMLGNKKPDLPHLPESYDFRNGKMWPNDRPGLGVVLDASKLDLQSEVTEYQEGVPQFHRQDGSFTNW
jgi:galactonate dehydratase